MSELDIAERRLPQDGRIKLKLSKGREMDFRVSVLPTLFGEKIVLRLLDKSNLQLDMTKLGFEVSQLEDFKRSIHQPFGMVLVTGPTGSGKTTTLYSALSDETAEGHAYVFETWDGKIVSFGNKDDFGSAIEADKAVRKADG